MTRALIRIISLGACALALTGCGGDDGGNGGGDSEERKVTKLELGETLTTKGTEGRYEVKLTADAEEGAPADLESFNLEGDEKDMTPWYVKTTVENVGKEVPKDVSVNNIVKPVDDGGLDAKKMMLLGDFPKCELVNTPMPFEAGATVESCSVYLVSKSAKLEKLVHEETRFEGADRVWEWSVE